MFLLERSWQAYVDDQLVGTGQLSNGVIIGQDGNTWAASPGFWLRYRLILCSLHYSCIFSYFRPGEGREIVSLFTNPADVFARGVTVGGVTYFGIEVTFSWFLKKHYSKEAWKWYSFSFSCIPQFFLFRVMAAPYTERAVTPVWFWWRLDKLFLSAFTTNECNQAMPLLLWRS